MRYASVDLSAYPVPDAITPLSYESELAARKAGFIAQCQARGMSDAEIADITQILTYEFEPIVGLLENDAYRDLTMIGRINDKVRAVMLASAVGSDLDHIGITYYRTPRRVITPADATTGTAAVLEDDETYRQRLALAPESWSVAGPEGAYIFFGLAASGEVLDIAVYSEDDGACLAPEVRVAVLAQGGVAPSGACLAAVRTALNAREIRPIGDKVTVEAVTPLPYALSITLQVRAGASDTLIKDAARRKVEAYTSGRIRWAGDGAVGPVWLTGRRIRLTTAAAAARVDGVEEVIINGLVADINVPVPGSTAHLFIAPICTAIEIVTEVVDEGWTS